MRPSLSDPEDLLEQVVEHLRLQPVPPLPALPTGELTVTQPTRSTSRMKSLVRQRRFQAIAALVIAVLASSVVVLWPSAARRNSTEVTHPGSDIGALKAARSPIRAKQKQPRFANEAGRR